LVRTSLIGKVAAMPMKYETETRAKAIRLVIEHSEDYAFEYEAIKTVAGRLGMQGHCVVA
jgi:transposase